MSSSNSKRLVVGLDYGTTYTGVSEFPYSGFNPGFRNGFLIAMAGVTFSDAKTSNVSDIELICDWPGTRRNATDEKVPSQIAYGNFPSGIRTYDWGTWGNYIPATASRLVSTKLQLDEKKNSRELRMLLAILSNDLGNLGLAETDDGSEDRPPSYPGKEPQDIVADYLTGVKDHVFDSIEKRVGQRLFRTLTVDVVIRVPAVWSDRAKDLTFKAVSQAGFGGQNGALKMVTEPEAAAIYTLKAVTAGATGDDVQPQDCFVLCDAGGGTVDLLSYRVKSVEPHFRVEEVAVGSGDKCGAVFVDRNFQKWLKKKIGNSAYENIPREKLIEGSRLVRDFEQAKISFDGTAQETYLDLPREVGVEDDASRDIQDGQLLLTADNLAEMFDPCVNRTIELINEQVAAIQKAGSQVKYVFLVGGFGKSDYLFKKVQEYCLELGFEARRPLFPWSAVARGAVARGLEPDGGGLVELRMCRLHYGTPVSVTFEEGIHDPDDAYIDEYTGEKMAKDARLAGQMHWLVSKGDRLMANSPKRAAIDCSTKFKLSDKRVFGALLCFAKEDNPPTRFKDEKAKILCIARADMRDVPETKFFRERSRPGEEHFVAKFRVEILVDNARLRFFLTFDGEECGSVEAQFPG